jgi:hypothetical protein
MDPHKIPDLRPYIEEVKPTDDEIERMIREEADHLMDPETKLVSVADLDAITSTRVRLVIERRLRETYPHLFAPEHEEEEE